MFSSFINHTNLYHGFYGFFKATPFGVWGGPEKDREVCFCGGGALRSFSSDLSGQQDVFWHDG